jgi:hypothetical protein
MAVITFIIWIVSLALLGVAAFRARPADISMLGLFAFDLWIGLQFLIETSDPFTL